MVRLMGVIVMVNMRKIIISCSICGTLLGQPSVEPPVKGQDNNAWTEDGNLVFTPLIRRHPKSPAVLVYSSGTERRLPDPPPMNAIAGTKLIPPYQIETPGGKIYYKNVQSINSNDSADTSQMEVKIFHFDENSWKWDSAPLGTLMINKFFSTVLLSDDYLLGISTNGKEFQSDNRYYPFAVFKRNGDGQYLIDHYEDGGLKTNAIDQNGNWAYPCFSTLWVYGHPVWTRTATIINAGNGLFWSFGMNGKLNRVINLFGSLSESRLQSDDIWNGCILGCQPSSSGQLVVSCLGGDAASKALAIIRTKNNNPTTANEAIAFNAEKIDAVVSFWPIVNWYTINPETGLINRFTSPAKIPNLITNYQDYMDYNWTFNMDGAIQMYSHKKMMMRKDSM